MEKGIYRPPIVVVLGHVDHGKTTLLDEIRETRVASREAGGITQKIGASVVNTSDAKSITFIDTPGHAAFSAMRSRGANVADVAVLVVAADDGVKPQTKEAIRFIKEANIPFVVVLTKMDLPVVNSEEVLVQLEKEGISLEKRGGDVPLVEVSAKEKRGIKELLDMIILVWEVSGAKVGTGDKLEAVVIESSKEKGGVCVSVVVRQGVLKLGQEIFIENEKGKVRNLEGEAGALKEVGPGFPCRVFGLDKMPPVGSVMTNILQDFQSSESQVETLDQEGKIGIYVKTASVGTLEAITGGLPEGFMIIASGVGDVTDSDILNAKSLKVAGIFTFESKTSASVIKLAEAEGVKIYNFSVIYELFDKLKEIFESGKTEVLGSAKIIAQFPFDGRIIAGCKVIQGKISKKDNLVLMRGDKDLGKIKAISLRKQKTEINEAKQGEEFGILFSPHLDFTIGDDILAIK